MTTNGSAQEQKGTSPAGVAENPPANLPTLFMPLTIRGLHLNNRFVVSPMGTWSCTDGHLSDFHVVHLGAFALRGAALTMVESTAVTANGRTSSLDSGLWQDSQIVPLRRVVDFIHSQGQKAGIQLNHGGRKASMHGMKMATGKGTHLATAEQGGWPHDIWAPSAIPMNERYATPNELSLAGIESVVRSFGEAAKRAVAAGVDFIELHGAHGYLIHQFLTPLSNTRTDSYGGSFDNRVRFLLQVVTAVRAAMPDGMPLSVRVSATEWMEWSGKPCWDFDQTERLARMLPLFGVDVLDVSSGGGHATQKIDIHPTYQIDLAARMAKTLREEGIPLLVAAVGLIDSAKTARDVVQCAGGNPGGQVEAHLAFVGRQFAREPGFVLRCARELGVDVRWPYQYQRL